MIDVFLESQHARADLRVARDLIARHGWTRRQLVKRGAGGRAVAFCAIGAVSEAARANGGGRRFHRLKASYHHLDEALPAWARWVTRRLKPGADEAGRIIAYNDLPFMTRGAVLRWFDRAIARADGGETKAR